MELHARTFGGEGLPPLVILHGMLGSSRNWQTAAQALGDWFRVHCLDLRNHGESPWAEPHSFAAMAEDVADWIAAKLGGRAILMGHSMGGKVAMKLACERPDRVRKLIVVDISPKTYPKSHDDEFAGMRVVAAREPGSRAEAEAILAEFVSDWAMRKFLMTNWIRDAATGAHRWAPNLEAIEPRLRELEQSPLQEGQRFEGETLFVMGGKSRYFSAEDLPEIRRRFPASAVEIIAESGHNPHFEARERFVHIVGEFAADR